VSTPGGLAWQGGWDEPGVLSVVIVESGQPGTGVFIYSGVPAAGNAPIGWISAATKDPFGNTLTPASNVVIGAGQDGSPQVVMQLSGTSGEISFPLPGTWTNYPNMFGQVVGSGGQLSVNGPTDSTVNDQAYVVLDSAANGVNGGSAGSLGYIDANGGNNSTAFWGDDGFTVNAGAVTGIKAGTGGSPTNPAQAESWHNFSTPSGWTDRSGTGQGFRYKLLGEKNMVALFFALTAPAGAPANGTVIGSLPSGYRPAFDQNVSVVGNKTLGTVPPPLFFVLAASGNIECESIQGGQQVSGLAIFPVD